MVLESIINPKNAENKPFHILIISFFYTILAVIVSRILFPSYSSILSIAFITIIFVPFFQKMFEEDEEEEDKVAENKSKSNILTRHKNSLVVFMAFFLGIIIAISFLISFFNIENDFSLQRDTIKGFSGKAVDNDSFAKYFANNTQVMILIFIFSIVFGAGSVFILAWNASVIGVYIANIVKNYILQGFATTTAYAYGLPVGITSILLHGLPEIGAYLVAGLAGGIISVGLIKEEIGTKEFNQVLKDSLIYLGIAEILIIAAAFIEAVI